MPLASEVGRARHVSVARERSGGYDVTPGLVDGDGSVGDRPAPPPPVPDGTGVLTGLGAAVDGVVAADLDGLDEPAVRSVLKQVQVAIDRLHGVRSRAAGVLESRAVRAAGPGREQGALRRVREQTAGELRLSPSQVKQAGEVGRRLAEAPAAQQAMMAGALPAEHARVLAETLQQVSGEVRPQVEAQLLDAARFEDARQFGRRCRRLLAQVDAQAAQDAQDRRNARRGLRVAETPDGMLAVHGQGSGWDAEVVATALHAFARPGAADRRSNEQRSWDALVGVCRTALDAGVAPANRGVRPHVLVTVPYPVLADPITAPIGDGAGPDACGESVSGIGRDHDGSVPEDADARASGARAPGRPTAAACPARPSPLAHPARMDPVAVRLVGWWRRRGRVRCRGPRCAVI